LAVVLFDGIMSLVEMYHCAVAADDTDKYVITLTELIT